MTSQCSEWIGGGGLTGMSKTAQFLQFLYHLNLKRQTGEISDSFTFCDGHYTDKNHTFF